MHHTGMHAHFHDTALALFQETSLHHPVQHSLMIPRERKDILEFVHLWRPLFLLAFDIALNTVIGIIALEDVGFCVGLS